MTDEVENARALIDEYVAKGDVLIPVLISMTKNQYQALAILSIVAGFLTMEDMSTNSENDWQDRKRSFLAMYNLLTEEKK